MLNIYLEPHGDSVRIIAMNPTAFGYAELDVAVVKVFPDSHVTLQRVHGFDRTGRRVCTFCDIGEVMDATGRAICKLGDSITVRSVERRRFLDITRKGEQRWRCRSIFLPIYLWSTYPRATARGSRKSPRM